jgi:hypothetical protein
MHVARTEAEAYDVFRAELDAVAARCRPLPSS